MLIALIARDKPDSLQVRLDTRDAHVAYLKSSSAVMQAGPLLDSHVQMIGSLIILEVDSLDVAEDWVANDPYGHAGLFESVELIPWKKVI